MNRELHHDFKANKMAKKELSGGTTRQESRREFLKSSALAAAALAFPAALSPFSIITRKATAQPGATDDPAVVTVRDTAAHSGSQINAGIAQVMLDEAVRRYTGLSNLGLAYKSLFPGISMNDVVGIKVNCINAQLSTHPPLVSALANGLQQMPFGTASFPANNIIIFDRSTSELQNAGYTLNTGTTGVRCFATNSSGIGYNSSVTLNCAGTVQHPSRLLTDHCDWLINFAVMKNATGCGLTMTLKNAYGYVSAPSAMHGTLCDPYIPAVNQQVRDVLAVTEALFIVDGIFGSYTGGPMGSPNFTWDGIILGQDRVAVDAVGRSILASYGCPTLAASVHVDTAAQAPYSLGTANLAQIQQVNVMNPSQSVEDLDVQWGGSDVHLDWSAPEYTGQFTVLRADNPDMAGASPLATVSGNAYTDPGAVNAAMKYFYRVVKTW
ncbi:MAG: DUF362 domain-containing protein [Candidatus Zixiibacteriota bacterium]|nr:MAG: DUF362 domain-containing protein [candidate division Zixibacteria bacterium]